MAPCYEGRARSIKAKRRDVDCHHAVAEHLGAPAVARRARHHVQWQQVFFSVLAMVVSVALGIALKRLPRADWRQAAPYALIIGGALGNAADRIARGHVVDFIQWHWKDYYWPSFNLGDVAIVVGVAGLVLSEGVSARRQRSPGARRAGR